MKIIVIIIHFCVFMTFSSCHRDTLYYATQDRAIVRLNIDWSRSKLQPNGVSAYVFDHHSGAAIGRCVISASPTFIDVSLPVGIYDLLILNNTEAELENVEFVETQNLSTFKMIITGNESSKYKMNLMKSDILYATECDVVASSIVSSLEIKPIDVDYFPEKPSLGQQENVRQLAVAPERVTELIDIEIDVMNITSAAGAPHSLFTDVAQGYQYGLSSQISNVVTHEFVLNNRKIDPDNHKHGKISKKFISFGLLRDGDKLLHNHILAMDFKLINGENNLVELDVTDIIDTSHSGTQYVHKIRAEIVLPEAIGNGDGAFHPDVDEWEDVDIELPI